MSLLSGENHINALLKRIEALELLVAGNDMNKQLSNMDPILKTAEQFVNEKADLHRTQIKIQNERYTQILKDRKANEEASKKAQEEREKQEKERHEESMYQQAMIKARVDARVRAQAHILEEEARQELLKEQELELE